MYLWTVAYIVFFSRITHGWTNDKFFVFVAGTYRSDVFTGDTGNRDPHCDKVYLRLVDTDNSLSLRVRRRSEDCFTIIFLHT